MNKKAHHEIGITPYLILIAIVGFIVAFGQKMYVRMLKK
jgi:hypothetical protein